jgi:large subunit ribosomal protein L35Ae
VKAIFTGFRRGKTTQNENQALLRIEGLNDRKEVNWYLGKRVVHIYKTKHGFRVRLLIM